jgi:MarC family membrane protein
MPLAFFVSAMVTLVLVVDPISLVPTFLGITERLSHSVRRSIALRACVIAGTILIGVALIGDWLLRQLGITLPAFRIAGGMLLFAVAAEMVLGLRLRREAKDAEQAVEEHVHDVAAFPLAIPMMAGPGAITATLLLAGQAAYRPAFLAALFVVIVLAMGACLAAFMAAERVGRFLGVTGNVVLSRLLGVILAALAVQYVVDGVRAALGSG